MPESVGPLPGPGVDGRRLLLRGLRAKNVWPATDARREDLPFPEVQWSDQEPDTVLVHARREGIIITSAWLVSMV